MEFTYILTLVNTTFVLSNNFPTYPFNKKAMTNTNTHQTAVNTTYVVNATKSEVKKVVAAPKEVVIKTSVNTVAGFAKNTRYSIYGNGGGYTGL